MKRFFVAFSIMAVALAGTAAFADAPVNFTWGTAPGGSMTALETDIAAWMDRVSQFEFGGDLVFALVDPDTAENNGNGIPDVDEFAVLTAICNDTEHALHAEVHEAFKANAIQFGLDMGGLAVALAPPLKFIMGAYATLGDGSYTREVSEPPVACEDIDEAIGSFGVVAAFLEGMSDNGSMWCPASGSAPVLANYTLVPDLLSICGDADGDDVGNGYEYYGQSMDGAAYALAALDPLITTCGTGPDPCAGDNYECLVPGMGYAYDIPNQKIYYLTDPMPFAEAEAAAQALTIASVAYPSHLVRVDSEAENDFITVLRNGAGEDCWLGASDLAVQDDWRWLEGNEQFWTGKYPTHSEDPGSAVGGLYSNWNDEEPNGDGEYYAELRSDGTWNDIADGDQIGIIEVVGVFPDVDPANGIPDAFEDMLCGPYGCGPVTELPDVVGQTQAAATATLEGLELDVDVTTEYSDTVAAGLVISQDPLAGTLLEGLSSVAIVVSLGVAPVGFAEQPVGGWFEAGESLTLRAPLADLTPPVAYQWEDLGGEIMGATTSTLVFDPLTELDTGSYRCVASNGLSKTEYISNWAHVLVFGEGELPVAGLLGLVLIAGLGAFGGAMLIRRKK